MMRDIGNFGWWGMGLGPVFMLVFLVMVIAGIVAIVRWLLAQSMPDRSSRDKTPLEIVQERYARGEIDKAEYEQKRQDLERRA